MYWRLLFNLFLIFILGIVQVAFVSALPFWLKNINLLIIFLVFILSLRGFMFGFWWTAGMAFILEIFSFLPFGVYFFSLISAFFLANFLLTNYFTNRSLYSYLALTLASLFTYQVLLYSLNYGLHYFLQEDFILNLDKSFLADKLEMFLVNILVVVLFFYIYNFISKNFQPVFLVRGQIKK